MTKLEKRIADAKDSVIRTELRLRDLKYCQTRGVLELRDPMVPEAEAAALAAKRELKAAREACKQAETAARQAVLTKRMAAAEAWAKETHANLWADLCRARDALTRMASGDEARDRQRMVVRMIGNQWAQVIAARHKAMRQAEAEDDPEPAA